MDHGSSPWIGFGCSTQEGGSRMESRFIQPIVDNLINLVLLYQKSDNLDLTIGLKKDYFCH
ncbi:MAG TPA: hypothetical protein PKJ34_11925, partial [Anaerolineaceae bacterium]|nr:hypothetical protein [Anaerolineaceae bacterium]